MIFFLNLFFVYIQQKSINIQKNVWRKKLFFSVDLTYFLFLDFLKIFGKQAVFFFNFFFVFEQKKCINIQKKCLQLQNTATKKCLGKN